MWLRGFLERLTAIILKEVLPLSRDKLSFAEWVRELSREKDRPTAPLYERMLREARANPQAYDIKARAELQALSRELTGGVSFPG